MAWHTWSPAVFQEAQERDCPILLYLAAPGCEGLFAAEDNFARTLAEERFVAVRVDPFRRPDIARRYDAGGWPALAVLGADGRAFALVVDMPPDNVQLFLWRILENYQKRRALIDKKIDRAASEQTRGKKWNLDINRVYAAAVSNFDTLHGGFGSGVKFIEGSVLRFLLDYAKENQDKKTRDMVLKILDAFLGSPMLDTEAGGVLAYSYTPDWGTPAREKDALDQAALVLLLLQAATGDESSYARAATDLVAFMRTRLFDSVRGVFAGRQIGTLDGQWWTDPAVYADRNALSIRALVAAARDLHDPEAAAMAVQAMDFLLTHCIDERGAVYHCYLDGERTAPGLLEDQALVAAALLDLYALRGEKRFARRADTVVHFMEEALFDSAAGAFRDRPEGATLENIASQPIISYEDSALPAGNILAAELYMDLNDLDRVATLLGNKRLKQQPGRTYSSYARALLRYERMRHTSP